MVLLFVTGVTVKVLRDYSVAVTSFLQRAKPYPNEIKYTPCTYVVRKQNEIIIFSHDT